MIHGRQRLTRTASPLPAAFMFQLTLSGLFVAVGNLAPRRLALGLIKLRGQFPMRQKDDTDVIGLKQPSGFVVFFLEIRAKHVTKW